MRLISLALLLSACGTPDSILEPADRPTTLAVEPGVGGEWDDPGATGEYRLITTTIQEAIDAANPGDTIEVQGGVFIEDLVMREGVHVVGAGMGETILQGTASLSGLATATRLSRMSIVNPGILFEGTGVDVDTSHAVLEELDVSLFEWGIKLNFSDNSVMNANVLRLNDYGVWADDSFDITVSNSMFRSNNIAGVTNYAGSGQVIYNTLVGNAFAASSQVGFGGALQFGNFDTELVKNNIVVSNFFGINCQDSCDNDFSNNLVWGNNTNYANEASAMGDDVNVDPQFNDPANFDFTLGALSPAIDNGNGTVGVVVDFEGDARPSGNGYDIGYDEFVQSDLTLLITEVMSNAAVETVGEFIEVYNAGTGPVDLAGLHITDGDDLDILMSFDGGSTVVAPGTWAVIVDPDYDGTYGIDSGVTVVTTGDTNVGNGLTTSDRVELLEADGATTIATFTFPSDPGDGVSIELINRDQGDVSGNWRGSVCTDGSSPGSDHCFPPSGDPAGLILTEVMAHPVNEVTDEFIEIYNPTNLEIDAAGLIIDDGDSTDSLQGFANSGTLIPPGGYALVIDPGYTYEAYYLPNGITMLTTGDQSLGNGLAQSDPVTLRTAAGVAIDSFSFPASTALGVSWEKADYSAGDVAGNWVMADAACGRGRSPGRLNGADGGMCDQLLITEVMANPLNEDRGEFIEIFNGGFDTVELAGLTLADGNQSDTLAAFNGGVTTLAPQQYAVIVDAEYDGVYDIPAGVTVVATTDTSLGNGLAVRDVISLYENDHLIDRYGFPFNAGNGLSVERIFDRATDAAENWVAAPCPNGASPGQTNCALGGNTGGSGTSLFTLVITEIMANANDEDTDEYVEIYNYGTDPIDLSQFVFWDGDAVDTIFDWFGGTDTVLMPGEYAVILDFEYDIFTDRYDVGSTGALLLTTSDTTLGSGLSTSDDVFLLEPDGLTLIDSFTSPSNPGNDISIEKIDLLGGDITSNWRTTDCGTTFTVGLPNCN